MNVRVIISAPNAKRDHFRVYSYSAAEYSAAEWRTNHSVPIVEMASNENEDIDTIFVVERDETARICSQSPVIGYKSGNSYGVAFNDVYWGRYCHMAHDVTYDEMIKRMVAGWDGRIKF